MDPAIWMWTSWVIVAGYGAWFAWREMWPEAQSLLRKAAALRAFVATGRGPSGAEVKIALRACCWLAGWVLICTAWSAFLLWGAMHVWAGAPLARALFG